MKNARRLGWSLLNALKKDRKDAKTPVGRAARLAAAAGQVESHTIEQLEQRQLLFTVSIGPGDVDPATGLGTRTVNFPYYAPFLQRTIPDAVAPVQVTENFDDEMAPWTTQVPAAPPNGTRFEQSNIQISYTSTQTTPVQLIRRGAQQGQQDLALRVSLQGTDRLSFQFFNPQGQDDDTPNLATSASFTIGNNSFPLPNDGNGLNTADDGTRIELLRNGQVVSVIRGAALAAIGTAVQGGNTRFDIQFAAGFDQVRFASAEDAPNNTAYADNFVIENITANLVPGRFAQFHQAAIFGATLSFTGPVGATVNVVDLYGRDMLLNNTFFGDGNGGGQNEPHPIDPNDDGIPDFNLGIGRVTITGTNQRSSMTIIGFLPGDDGPEYPDGPTGFTGEFEGAGFGYDVINNNGTPELIGLPPVGTSVLIGSPIVRPITSPGAYFAAPPPLDFNRTDQGVFVTGGASIGSILMMGAVFGSSRVDGAIARWSVGTQVGSLRVDGDVGSFTSQTDAGLYFNPNGSNGSRDNLISTSSRLNIGRTVREIDIGGRNFMNVSVLADVNSTSRTRLSQRDFVSRERVYQQDPQLTMPVDTITTTIGAAAFWYNGVQAVPFGSVWYRNDNISNAEFVGYNGTSVRIQSTLNGLDSVNAVFDQTDVYAFPAEVGREIVIDIGSFDMIGLDIRVVDRDGRSLAGFDSGGAGRGAGNANNASRVIRFRPTYSDVFYLVLNAANDPQVQTEAPYTVSITGMAPVTMGAFRVASGAAGNTTPYTVSLASGSMGSIRVGTGILFSGTNNLGIDAIETSFQEGNSLILLTMGASTFNVPGNLYSLYTGTDINGAQIQVRGNIGVATLGMHESLRSIINGDLYNADIRAGGSIAVIDVKGALAVNQVPQNQPENDARNGIVNIQAGTQAGLRGDIGQILVGAYANGGGTFIRTSAGSQFDQFTIGYINEGAGSERPAEIVNGAPNIAVGDGSDVRFLTYGSLSSQFNPNVFEQIGFGQSVTYTDDAGASVTISISGGTEPAPGTDDPRLGSTAVFRFVAINGSRGVAIARIDTTLLGGASLIINGQTAGVVSIGRIIVLNATSGTAGGVGPVTPAPNPNITISGTTEIDVHRIDVRAGTIDLISNTTPGGDIVAIDANAVRNVTISGDLGLTQTVAANTTSRGLFLDITGQAAGVGGPLFVNPAAINIGTLQWNGQDSGALNIIGSPIDQYLSGVVARTGDLENVNVRGKVGDVIAQTGHIISVVANSDGLTPQGDFQGIFGNIYADAIGTIDVGDGLLGTGPGPFAAASIVANQAIIRVFGGTRTQGVRIEGIIMAAGVGGPLTQLGTSVANPQQLEPAVVGISTVELTNGIYDTAFIYGGALDDWWRAVGAGEEEIRSTDVGTVRGINSDLFRSEVWGINLAAITLTNADWDASYANFNNNIGTISADEFRNSTRLGQADEFFRSRIIATNNIANIQTNGLNGNMSDLSIDAGASVTGQIAARNIDRTDIAVDNTVASVRSVADIRSSTVEAGRLRAMVAGGSIRSTTLRIAGPVESVTAANEITQFELNSSGPDGRVDLVRATNLLNADIVSSGNIGTIESVTSDVTGSIVTRNDDVRANNGGLTTLRAGRDIIASVSILGDTGTIFAARNIGALNVLNPDVDLRGNVGNITAQTGQIYSDLIVGQAVTGAITIGRVSMKPGNDLVATADILTFGRINSIVINGDFNGNITSRSGGIGSIVFNSGSFRPGNAITVNNGDLTQLTLNGGDLLGDVLVDGNIDAIDVLNGPDGFKGQIGIASWRRNFRPVPGDPLRNQLPPEVQRTENVDGVTIRAGGNIGRVFVQQGSFTESRIIAGGVISNVDIALQLRNDALTRGLNNAIVAGERIERLRVGGFTGAVGVVAGMIDLGTDGRLGGTGDAADTVGSGSIGQVLFQGPKVVNSVVSAGINPNAAGQYNKNDALAATGRSSIDNVTANTVVNVSAYSAGTLGTTSAGIARGGSGLAAVEPDTIASATAQPGDVELVNGVAFQFQLASGERGRATLTGPGRVFWNASSNLLRLLNTTEASTLTITANGQFLTGLRVLGNVLAALGTLSVTGTLRGDSSVFVNGNVTNFSVQTVDALNGLFGSGGDVSNFTTGNFLAGIARAKRVGSFVVSGDFGRSAVESDAFAQFLSVASVNVTGAISGAISSDRTIPTVTAGSVNNGGVRSGQSITSFTSGPMNQARISARSSIGSVTVNGNALESQILGGADLGLDADYGGTGRNADVVGSGSVNSVVVNGDFRKSDVAAGVIAGPSGFYGNTDTVSAAGRSSIGTVTVTGNQVGSSLNSEQYRVISNGTIGAVTVGGTAFTGAGNFRVERLTPVAVPVRVLDLFVTESSRIFTANIVFNQPVDVSTLSDAISILELRNSGATTIGLAEGSDYTITYDRAKNTVRISFSRAVTERNLPQTAGIPAPGVFQFVISAQVLRGSTQDSRLDGNADSQPGDDFARNVVVGDAGDKINAGNPAADPTIDFYGAADLDLILRENANIGSLPDINKTFQIRGSIGDHPDTDPDLFRLGGDVDVYRITLRAGQILRMGAMQGIALAAARGIYSSTGQLLASANFGGQPGSAIVRLPSNTSLDPIATPEDQYLVSQSGTYFIVVAGSLNGVDISDPNAINNIDPVASAFGPYNFSLTVFDDGNTGFVGDTNSGTGADVATPPVPAVFAGTDGVFGTGDDLNTFTSGDWVFTLTPGAGGPNSAGSVVTGVNGQGWTVTRRSAPNGTFGTANDRIFTSIGSSIGLPGASGVPNEVSPDVDIFRLNSGQPIAPGTKIRATIRLTGTGSNIGLSPELTATDNFNGITLGQDLRGHAQFALFETPQGTGFGDARMVASSSDFLPIGAQPAQTTTDGRNSYGYDENGDYFFEFVVPGALGPSGLVPASYALYLQGAIRSDYTLEIVQQGTGSTATQAQNVLLETQGGIIDWLEAGRGLTTKLDAFTTSVIGFTGEINGQSVDQYVLNNLVSSLNAIFLAANVQINISTDPASFSRQPFSSVILAGNVEPSAFVGDQVYGASEKVDFFNVDKNDQAVVFVSSLADFAFEPSTAGVDMFVKALTAAVARRIGELVGVRFETNVASAATPVPVMAADSVANQPTVGTYAFVDQTRPLAGLADNATDTVFYLGSQNSSSLIQRVVLQRPV